MLLFVVVLLCVVGRCRLSVCGVCCLLLCVSFFCCVLCVFVHVCCLVPFVIRVLLLLLVVCCVWRCSFVSVVGRRLSFVAGSRCGWPVFLVYRCFVRVVCFLLSCGACSCCVAVVCC